ncbi:MAG: hypothetical protein JJE17_05925 [Peptostreptococcaceae bacterium]|nr:hypothetical protein [Peptostreptococcaceae bacterium]
MLSWLKIFIVFLSLPAYLGIIILAFREGQEPQHAIPEIELGTIVWTFIWITVPYWLLIGGIGFWFTGTAVYYPFW